MKLAPPRVFVRDAANYRVLPLPLAKAYGWLLPYVELGTAVLLVAGWQTRWAGVAALLMLASFMVAMGITMKRGQNLHCYCFGLLYRERIGWATLARDDFLVLAALLVVLADDGSLFVGTLIEDLPSVSAMAALGLQIAVLAVAVTLSYASIRSNRTVHQRIPSEETAV